MAWFTRSKGASPEGGAQSALPAVTTENFDRLVVEASNSNPVFVDFWAPWCRPCKAMDPVLAELATRYDAELDIVAVDIQAEPDLAARLQILSIPFLAMYRGGQQVAALHGAQPKRKLTELIDETIANS